jgi:hypothetical protein
MHRTPTVSRFYLQVQSGTHAEACEDDDIWRLQTRLAADGEGLVRGPMKAMSGGEVAAKDVVIPDITGERCPFIAEALYNGHNLFVMVTGKKAARFGRRVRVAAS